ncbi:terminase small subunit [Rhodococcus phage ChewyVIII]|uniref:Terminase small subunit n=1 Tax=Rhodococcus phage ChewyVIII TaxID=1887657 RepID=A0A1C9EI05_9CAUD|nr:terminase small subunit [Rhodococcus phage ChewyVIII]AON97424.1 terminase small subunit [Rhodococcus phage ChewyVIII]
MAGYGPPPSDPNKKTRTNKTSTRATLSVIENPDIPPMPPAVDFVAPAGKGQQPRWNAAVTRWWNDIWSSPMSGEFQSSDIHGLYLGCKQLHEALNPMNKPTDQASFMTKFEQTIRNFGLNPMARRALQWEIERGTEAETKTQERERKMREAAEKKTGPTGVVDPRKGLSG